MQSKTLSDVDILVLGIFVPSGLTGIYAVAYSVSKFLDAFARGITSTLFPEMSKLSAGNEQKKLSMHTESALTYAGLLLIPGTVGAAVIGDRILRIFGPEFEQGVAVLVILFTGVLIFTYAKQLLSALNAIDRPDLAFRTNGAFISSNITLNVMLVWQIGWTGAAFATALSALVAFVFAFYYSKPLINFRIPYAGWAYEWSAAMIMGVAVYLLRAILDDNWIQAYNEVYVVFLACFGALVYFIILMLTFRDFRETVENNIPYQISFL